jgi:hypothetical protein
MGYLLPPNGAQSSRDVPTEPRLATSTAQVPHLYRELCLPEITTLGHVFVATRGVSWVLPPGRAAGGPGPGCRGSNPNGRIPRGFVRKPVSYPVGGGGERPHAGNSAGRAGAPTRPSSRASRPGGLPSGPDGTQHRRPVSGQPSAPAGRPPAEVGQAVERVVGHRLPDQRPERLDRLQLRGTRREEAHGGGARGGRSALTRRGRRVGRPRIHFDLKRG